MFVRTAIALLLTVSAAFAVDPTAARLASEAKKAEDAGQVVRAYLLLTEASRRDPHNAAYAAQREALKPLAKLMTESHVEDRPDITADIRAAEAASNSEPLPEVDAHEAEIARISSLQPPPHVEPRAGTQSFDLRGDDRSILTQIARRFGVDAVFDPGFQPGEPLHLVLDDVSFEAAMSAATEATDTFAFATSSKRIFIARDTEPKRGEFEPDVLATVDIPDATDQREVVEAATAVKGVMGLRGIISWSPTDHIVILRDHPERVQAAAALLQLLIMPKAQVSFEVQLMAVDSDATYVYGINWQTAYQFLPFGLLKQLPNAFLPSIVNATNFLPFGGGATLLGVGLTDASLLANYTSTSSSVLYDASLLVGSGQTGTLHVGDKYPIASALNTGAPQSGTSALYNPIGQVTQQDLGLSLKLSPHVAANGDIYLELEADYQTLGSITVDTVPSINERTFKGSLTLQEGQWAVIGGMREDERSVSSSGLPGGVLPGLDFLLDQTTRDHTRSDTLLVIKPTITRLPMSSDGLRAYLVGPRNGTRTIF